MLHVIKYVWINLEAMHKLSLFLREKVQKD